MRVPRGATRKKALDADWQEGLTGPQVRSKRTRQRSERHSPMDHASPCAEAAVGRQVDSRDRLREHNLPHRSIAQPSVGGPQAGVIAPTRYPRGFRSPECLLGVVLSMRVSGAALGYRNPRTREGLAPITQVGVFVCTQEAIRA